MSAGTAARRLLGPLFPVAGAVYRRVFENIDKVASAVPSLPHGSLLLDVGGGDGALLNPLLRLQPTLRATLVDIAPIVGGFLRADVRGRVELRPGTSVRDYIDSGGEAPAAVLMADVFHHLAPSIRLDVIRDVCDVFGENPLLVIVKDVQPTGLRARTAFWADRYVSGDRGVTPIELAEVVDLFRSIRPDIVASPTTLLAHDHPNYCVVLSVA
jgi:hypothetical protein